MLPWLPWPVLIEAHMLMVVSALVLAHLVDAECAVQGTMMPKHWQGGRRTLHLQRCRGCRCVTSGGPWRRWWTMSWSACTRVGHACAQLTVSRRS